MSPDVIDLRSFYATPLGDAARRILGAAIEARAPRPSGARVLGLGFAIPYLDALRPGADLTVAAMPAGQGALVWPDPRPTRPAPPATSAAPRPPSVPGVEAKQDDEGRSAGVTLSGSGRTVVDPQADAQHPLEPRSSPPRPLRTRAGGVLVEPDDLPFADSSVDLALAVHAIEFEVEPGAVLAELWRVLAPGGRLVVVVPSRIGLWARVDATPFGQGRPYSRRQLEALLGDARFTLEALADALFVPPTRRRWLLRSAPHLERLGPRLAWPFAGVHVAVATKQVHQPVLVRSVRRAAARFRPAFAPAG